MPALKKCFYLLTVSGIALACFSSCNNSSADKLLPAPQAIATPQVTVPLKLSKAKKIDWAGIKAMTVHPVTEKFDLNALPTKPLDTSGFRPFSKPVDETRFDMSALAEKDLDISKVPSIPLKFKTYLLPPPKLIKAGPPRLKKADDLSLFEFGEAQGLVGNTVSCLYTDHAGFLWIATDAALYRYDGESLYSYAVPIENVIFSMIQDKYDRFWMNYLGPDGILLFEPNKGTVKKAWLSADHNGRPFKLMLDAQQNIWISATGKKAISIIDPDLLTIRSFSKKQGITDTLATGMLVDDKKSVWVGTAHGIDIFDLDHKKVRFIDKINGLASDTVAALFYDKSKQVWLASNKGDIRVINPRSNTITELKDAAKFKNALLGFTEDNDGRVWETTTSSGVQIIDLHKRKIKNLSVSNGLNSNIITTPFLDSKRQLWLATVQGINIVGNNAFVDKQIGNTATGTLMEDGRGLVWQGSYIAGLNILDLGKNTDHFFGVKEGLLNDSVQAMRSIKGRVFVCSNGGLNIIDTVKHTNTRISGSADLKNGRTNGVLEDKAGLIWLAGGKGVDVYDPVNNTVKFIGKAQGLSDSYISDMNIDLDGNIWITLSTGAIDRIDPSSFTISHIENSSVVNEAVTKILMPDDKGNMWIGGHEGAFMVDTRRHLLTQVSVAQGLASNTVVSLLCHGGQMFAGTFKGISVITPSAGKWGIKTFGNAYGLKKVNVTSYQTDMIRHNGEYWWGDVGITVLNLPQHDTSTDAAYVSQINVMDKRQHFIDGPKFTSGRNDTLWSTVNDKFIKGPIPASAGYTISGSIKWDSVGGPAYLPVNLHLPYDKNFLQFRLGNLNLARRDSSWYRYYLTGADTQWSDPTDEGVTRNYFNLKPGVYTFEVTVRNPNGSWGKPGVLSFTIDPPWWHTWWSYLLDICLLGGFIYAFVHYRSVQLVKEKRILEHKVHVRTEEVMQQKEEIEAQRDNLEKALGELKVTQSQLVQSEKLASLGELTAGIAHEIQNPLNFVNNFAEVSSELIAELRDEQTKTTRDVEAENEIMESLEQNLQKIALHGKRADGIVKNMLQHSRNNSGERYPVDINALADEYFRLSYHGLRAKDKSFNSAMETAFDPGLPKINIIPQDVGRVMLNMFNNAFYAVHQKKKQNPANGYQPTVILGTSVKRGKVQISVRDNGNGIPDAIKDKIMQPFFTTKPAGEGTGLGLSLSFDIIVKGHGGSIDINTKEGEFTEFVITLPITVQAFVV